MVLSALVDRTQYREFNPDLAGQIDQQHILMFGISRRYELQGSSSMNTGIHIMKELDTTAVHTEQLHVNGS